METLQAIAARRSIRKFKHQDVSRETVEAVLQAAILAPSGKNRQPWRFVVVAGDEKRAQMIRVLRAGIEETREQGITTGTAIGLAGRAAPGTPEATTVRGRALVPAGCFLFPLYTTDPAYTFFFGEEANSPVCTKGDA